MISPATLEMLDELAAISRRALANVSKHIAPLEPDAWRETMRALIESPEACFVVARERDKIIGWHIAVRSPIYFAPSKSIASTLTLWVDPEHRRDGIGSALAEAVEQWARKHGCSHLSAGVYERVGEAEPIGSSRASAAGSGAFYGGRGFAKSETNYLKELR